MTCPPRRKCLKPCARAGGTLSTVCRIAAPFQSVADFVRLANCWRTTGDITDTWKSMSDIGFAQERWAASTGPGHWNDPDMLVVGYVGWGPRLHPTRLTPNEQYLHISLWSLLSAPLLIGCDLDRIDEFTLGLLTNDEVLEVNQDPLGKPAKWVHRMGSLEVISKELEDGSHAVGLFNRGRTEIDGAVAWPDLGVNGKQTVRDLWRQKTWAHSTRNSRRRCRRMVWCL